jgi:hypothetical protein
MATKRKVVQIAVASANGIDGITGLYALCSDGTMWSKYNREWNLIESVPDDDSVPDDEAVDKDLAKHLANIMEHSSGWDLINSTPDDDEDEGGWTEEKPTKPGFYWYSYPEFEPVPVHVGWDDDFKKDDLIVDTSDESAILSVYVEDLEGQWREIKHPGQK